MKIWLINPATVDMVKTEVPDYVSKEVGSFPPVGLLYLAGYIRENGYKDISIIDMPAEDMTYEYLAQKLETELPDFVGITGTTHNLIGINRVAHIVRDSSKDIPVCIGGPHAERFASETLQATGVDFVIRGEGELSLLKLLNALEKNNNNYENINGLCYRKSGNIVISEPASPVEDLDSLPFPARDLLDSTLYYYVLGKRSQFTTIITSRGCPYKCIFCSTPHGSHRARSPENIVDEMEFCISTGSEEFHFIDDTFNIRTERLAEVSNEIIRRKLNVRWSFRGRADALDEESLCLARKAGCVRMHIGVESGTDEGLKQLRKGTNTASIERGIKLAKKHGITVAVYFLIGCPHEKSRMDVMNNLRFACKLNPDFALFNILAIYPDTQLHDMAVEKGLIPADLWHNFALNPTADFIIPFWEETFTKDQLIDMLQTAYRRFYIRPIIFWKNLCSLKSFGELRHKATAMLSILAGDKK